MLLFPKIESGSLVVLVGYFKQVRLRIRVGVGLKVRCLRAHKFGGVPVNGRSDLFWVFC